MNQIAPEKGYMPGVMDALGAFTRAQANTAAALYRQNIARDALTRAIGQR